MPEVTVNFSIEDFKKASEEINGMASELPYVIANLLNDGAFKTRQVLVSDTWPSHVQVRNASFINAALRVEKANKNNLEVAIYDSIGHGHLKAHAEGGTKRVSGPRIAIPDATNIRKGARGVWASQTPKAIIARTPKRALRITKTGIFVGRGGQLHRAYAFKPSVQIKASVPFYQDFKYVMDNAIRTGFKDAMNFAMKKRGEQILRRFS
jgi:hypothetical protein